MSGGRPTTVDIHSHDVQVNSGVSPSFFFAMDLRRRRFSLYSVNDRSIPRAIILKETETQNMPFFLPVGVGVHSLATNMYPNDRCACMCIIRVRHLCIFPLSRPVDTFDILCAPSVPVGSHPS